MDSFGYLLGHVLFRSLALEVKMLSVACGCLEISLDTL